MCRPICSLSGKPRMITRHSGRGVSLRREHGEGVATACLWRAKEVFRNF